MPRGTKRLVLENFLGGLNTRDDPVDLPANESPYFYDWVPYGEGGSIIQRDGDQVAHSYAAGGILQLGFTHALPNLLLAYDSAGKVLAWDPLANTQTTVYDPAGTPPGVTTELAPFAFVEAPASGGQGPLYFRAQTNTSSDIYRQSSGSAASAAWTASAGAIPTAHWFLYFANRVWAFGTRGIVTSANNARFAWSELGDPRNWPAANTAQLDPGDGEDFTGGGTVGEVLILFKRNKAWVVYDLDTGANRPLGMDVGAKDHKTICTTPIGLFFIDPARGPMVTDGASTSSLDGGTKVPWDTFGEAVYLNDRIYCAVAGSLNGLYEYHIKTKSWWRHSCSRKSLAVDLVTKRLYGGHPIESIVHEILVSGVTTLVPGGGAINPEWHSAYLPLGAPGERKRIRSIRVVGAASLAFSVAREVDASFTALGTGAITAPGLYLPTAGLARLPAFKVIGSAGGVPRLDQIIVDYSVRQR